MRISPISDDKGNVILYDIWIDGMWQGSRRTREQAFELVKQRRK